MHAKSLFERLKSQDYRYQKASLDDVLTQIFDNLECIFNSHQGNALISKHYGLPDFNQVSTQDKTIAQTMETIIKEIIVHLEKRITILSVTNDIEQRTYPGQVVFNISADVNYLGESHTIAYQTIMTGSGRVLVRR